MSATKRILPASQIPTVRSTSGSTALATRACTIDASATWTADRTVSSSESAPTDTTNMLDCSAATRLVVQIHTASSLTNYTLTLYSYNEKSTTIGIVRDSSGSAVSVSAATAVGFYYFDVAGLDFCQAVVTTLTGTSIVINQKVV